MKHIYFSSTLMWNATLPELFQTASQFGADGIELWAQQFESRNYSEEECLRLLDQSQLRLLIHSKSWDLNYASLNRSIREASLSEIKNSIHLAEKLHAQEITIHPPHASLGKDLPLYRELAYQGFCEILQSAHRAGVTVSLEVMEKTLKELMTTPQQVRELTRDLYPDFSYTLDIAHCDTEEEVRNGLSDLSNLSKLHISNRRGKTYHTLLPDGDFNFQKLWPLLTSSHLPMVVEGFDRSSQYADLFQNIKFIQTLKECSQ
ncbi:MAG: sugar phosphate isomerase/epimerase [Oscillospiraceae bacterium]|jgi:sugar phosphate isomerase/epimerase|nr:sugar phosphate isomerase/epimerase [Oscillospiraceae bacterium]